MAQRTDTLSAVRPGQAPAWLRRIHELPTTESAVVYCPARKRAVALEECRNCGACRGLFVDTVEQASFLRCALGLPGALALPADEQAPGDTYSEGSCAQLPVTMVMQAPLRFVEKSWSLAELAQWFVDEQVSAAPVVDKVGGEVIGVVSKTDLVTHFSMGELQSEPAPTVADVMTYVLFGIHGSAEVGRAAALMAYEGVHHLLVWDARGEPIGMLSALDLLRRMAQDGGYGSPSSDLSPLGGRNDG